ncbi:MAG: alpha/beta hydrolase [Gammaproteobacteria bacterium]
MTEKQTLYLLPGLLSDDTVWRHQMDHLSDLAHVVVPDYRNCDSITAMAESVLAGAPDSFAVAGHSMGGRVALELFRLAQDRISRIALLDSATGPAAAGEEEKRMGWVKLAREEGMAALADTWLPPMVHPDRHDDDAFMQELTNMIGRFTPEQFHGEIRALLNRPDATPLLGRIHCSALVLCGRQDNWCSPGSHAEMAAAIPGAEFEIVEDCGHMAPVEKPEEVTAALRRWLLY